MLPRIDLYLVIPEHFNTHTVYSDEEKRLWSHSSDICNTNTNIDRGKFCEAYTSEYSLSYHGDN